MSRHLIYHIIDKLSDAGSTTTGPTQMLHRLVARGDRQRYEFRVWVLRRDEVARAAAVEHGLPVHCLARHPFDPRVLGDLHRIVADDQPALLHVHGFAASNYGRWIGRQVGVPVLIHEHGVNDSIPLYQRVADSLLRRLPAEVIAVSDDVARYVTRERLIPAARVHTIHNGVDVSGSTALAGSEVDALRREYDLAGRRPIGIIGRLHPVKGQQDLIRAGASIVRRFDDAVILIIGDGVQRDHLGELTQELGLTNHVRFLGHRDDVSNLLKAMDVLVVASHKEAISLAMLEAMASGRAVVATRVGGIPEVLEDGISGLLVPPAEPDALAGAILRLLGDEALRERLGRAAIDRVRRSFDLDDMVRKVEQVYERLIGDAA